MIFGADALVCCQHCNLYIKRTESAGPSLGSRPARASGRSSCWPRTANSMCSPRMSSASVNFKEVVARIL